MYKAFDEKYHFESCETEDAATFRGFEWRNGPAFYIRKYIYEPLVQRGYASSVNELINDIESDSKKKKKIWRQMNQDDFERPIFGPEITSKFTALKNSDLLFLKIAILPFNGC